LASFAISIAGTVWAHECKCRANGQSYQQGQVACVLNKLQRCDMLLNNSSWKVIANICPLASLAPGLAKAAPMPDELPRSERPRL
jgi:hypothetical protein